MTQLKKQDVGPKPINRKKTTSQVSQVIRSNYMCEYLLGESRLDGGLRNSCPPRFGDHLDQSLTAVSEDSSPPGYRPPGPLPHIRGPSPERPGHMSRAARSGLDAEAGQPPRNRPSSLHIPGNLLQGYNVTRGRNRRLVTQAKNCNSICKVR